MAHQMTVTLSDQEYQFLTVQAAKSGKPPEVLLHDLLRNLQAASVEQNIMTEQEFAEKLYREGKLASLAKRRPLSKEEHDKREKFIQSLPAGKPGSEMII